MVLGLIGCLLSGNPVLAQQTDPTLTAAVLAQTAELKSIHKKRKKTQEQIIAAEAAVTVALDRVHSVENKMLESFPMPKARCRTCIKSNVQGNW